MLPEPIEAVAEPGRVEEIVAIQALQSPDRLALIEEHRSWNYGELQCTIEGHAKRLAQCGVRPHDRVMLVCENSLSAIALYFACASLNAWPVIVNARVSAREIDEIHAHCQSRLMVFTVGSSRHAKEHAARCGAAAPELSGPGTIAVSPLRENAEPEPAEDDGPSEVAAIIYTTGTTGRPKGIVLTHRNLLFVARATAEARRLTPEDRVYATLPISHSLGLSGVLLGSLLSGAAVHLPPRFDPPRILSALGHAGISVTIGTPSMYALLAEYATRNGLAPIAAPALRLISSAGAPLDPSTKAQAEAAFGQTLHNGYGISECGPSIALTSLDAPRSDCSVGRLLPGVEAKLVGASDENGQTAIGELWVRSPGVMKGYYGAPEETREAIDAEGWFRTGDLARMEEDHLFIVARAKEMIVRFGFNVYPAEVEAVLNAHPDVARSAVIGRAGNGTEEIVAFVQPAARAKPTPAELADYAGARLASYKRPSEVILVGEMPMSPNGKIRKAQLHSLSIADAQP